jgi:leucyl/phenylalanyl-tRNA--protein transferase
VGGVYGIAIGSCFCAESMFHRRTNASKVALWAMVEKCRELGFTIFDAQIMNQHLRSLGAYEVPHEEYMAGLRVALSQHTDWS